MHPLHPTVVSMPDHALIPDNRTKQRSNKTEIPSISNHTIFQQIIDANKSHTKFNLCRKSVGNFHNRILCAMSLGKWFGWYFTIQFVSISIFFHVVHVSSSSSIFSPFLCVLFNVAFYFLTGWVLFSFFSSWLWCLVFQLQFFRCHYSYALCAAKKYPYIFH